jgi:NitT/TauT family transport system substrate-binding protein
MSIIAAMLRSTVLTSLIVLAVLGTTPANAAEAKLDKVRVGVLPISDTLPVWIGRDNGFFEQEGIQIEIVPIQGGAVGIPAMIGGSLDVTYSDVGTILKSAEKGVALQVVAPAGVVARFTYGSGSFLARNDGTIEQLADVKGKRVAVNLRRNITEMYAVAALADAGVPPGSYTLIELPYAQMPDALLNGQVDLISEVDPFYTMLKNTGRVRDFGQFYHRVHPNLRVASYVAATSWVKGNEALVRRFKRAYARAAEHVMANEQRHGEWQTKYFRAPPKIAEQLEPLRFDPEVDSDHVASLVKTKALMRKFGFLDQDVDVASLIHD